MYRVIKQKMVMDEREIAMYMIMNPRCHVRSINIMHTQVVNWLIDNNCGQLSHKFDSQLHTCLHKSSETKLFVDLDIRSVQDIIWLI